MRQHPLGIYEKALPKDLSPAGAPGSGKKLRLRFCGDVGG